MRATPTPIGMRNRHPFLYLYRPVQYFRSYRYASNVTPYSSGTGTGTGTVRLCFPATGHDTGMCRRVKPCPDETSPAPLSWCGWGLSCRREILFWCSRTQSHPDLGGGKWKSGQTRIPFHALGQNHQASMRTLATWLHTFGTPALSNLTRRRNSCLLSLICNASTEDVTHCDRTHSVSIRTARSCSCATFPSSI